MRPPQAGDTGPKYSPSYGRRSRQPVRVEGAGTTLLPTTPVNTRGVEFTVAGGGICSGTTLGGALQVATNGAGPPAMIEAS